jgi:TolB-like protein
LGEALRPGARRIFTVQNEITERIAGTIHQPFLQEEER